MGDAGEGLIDQDSRIQERMDEIARERAQLRAPAPRDPEQQRALESLRLARTELERQLAATTHEGRRAQIGQAMAEIDRRIATTSAGDGPSAPATAKK
jgi:septal ring factor EnvC (AmiA/AmiB activator)